MATGTSASLFGYHSVSLLIYRAFHSPAPPMSVISARRYALELEERALSQLLSNIAIEKQILRTAELRNRNASRPINVLSDALLGDIFQYVHDDALPSSPSVLAAANSRNRTLLTLMATCHRWLGVSVGRGALWSRICVAPFASVEKIELDIQRAQDAPIDLTIIPNPAGKLWPHLPKLFDPLLHRCRNLQVVGCIGDTSFIFPLPSRMPQLQSLELAWQVKPGHRPQDSQLPAIFPPDAVCATSIERLSLQLLNPGNISTPTSHPLGLGKLDLGALRWLEISFDFLPTNLCDILNRAPNLLSLNLTRQGSRRDTVPRVPDVGPKPGVITFPHLKEASLRGLPHSTLCQIYAPHLESLTVDSIGDLDFIAPMCNARSGPNQPNSGTRWPMLKTFRMLANPHGPSEICWQNFFTSQPHLEEIECQNSSSIHSALVTAYPATCKRIRHIKLKWSFYPLALSALTRGQDMGEAFIDTVSSALTTLLRRNHYPLEDGEPGLRITLELADAGDIGHLDDLVASHPRVRILPRDQPWADHPEWPQTAA